HGPIHELGHRLSPSSMTAAFRIQAALRFRLRYPDTSAPNVARACQGCDLYERATQTLFGQGAADAAVVLIGEQPGDAEDRAGKPFAGLVSDLCVAEAALPGG